jgi:saccharopine dehydrogenase-like NADP-dependent oxidoreductase
MSKVIAVFGATGAQGGSVALELLKEPSKWKVVVVTRNANSEKAKELQTLGAEVRIGDLDNIGEVEAVLKVLFSYLFFSLSFFFSFYFSIFYLFFLSISNVKQKGSQYIVQCY